MTVKKMEQQLAALTEKRDKIRKELTIAKRQEQAKQRAAKRRQEQVEAVAFMRFCKTLKLDDKPDAKTVYEWATERMKSSP